MKRTHNVAKLLSEVTENDEETSSDNEFGGGAGSSSADSIPQGKDENSAAATVEQEKKNKVEPEIKQSGEEEAVSISATLILDSDNEKKSSINLHMLKSSLTQYKDEIKGNAELEQGLALWLSQQDNATSPQPVYTAKYFNTHISKKDLEAFEQAVKNSTTEKFINAFIKQHQIDGNGPTEADFYTLLLTTAISFKHIQTINYILHLKHKENILVNVDDAHFSPISCAFHTDDQEILALIREHITNNPDLYTKKTTAGEDRDIIIALKNTPSPLINKILEEESIDYVHELIDNIYTESSLSPSVTTIGTRSPCDSTEET